MGTLPQIDTDTHGSRKASRRFPQLDMATSDQLAKACVMRHCHFETDKRHGDKFHRCSGDLYFARSYARFAVQQWLVELGRKQPRKEDEMLIHNLGIYLAAFEWNDKNDKAAA